MSRFFTLVACLALRSAHGRQTPEFRLPEVDTVLAKSAGTAEEFAANAQAMQKTIATQHEKFRLTLGDQKLRYEAILNQLYQQNANISAVNAQINMRNGELKLTNRVFKENLTSFMQENEELHSALDRIAEKLGLASQFVAHSLEVTDDSDAEELQAIAPSMMEPPSELPVYTRTLLQLPEVPAESVRESPMPKMPESMIADLSESFEQIAAAEEDSQIELENSFRERFEETERRQQELNETQVQLLQLRSDLIASRKELLRAEAHLKETQVKLQERLRSVRTFAQKVDSTTGTLLELSNLDQALAEQLVLLVSAEPTVAVQKHEDSPEIEARTVLRRRPQ